LQPTTSVLSEGWSGVVKYIFFPRCQSWD